MVSTKPTAESLFLAAVELPPDRRHAYLAEACGNDVELRARVERLLAAQLRVDSFLESPAPELGAANDPTVTELPGTTIGPYTLLEQIGEGGFGVVFLAEQATPIRRRVALKIVKPGMDTRQVIARFEAERQALALMDHPGIAKVFDAGVTDQGRSYFVMELVQGVPITQYCDECQLPTRERLELFIAVCQAVQHAHQKGIIHRDLKPTNVLVAMQDGRPVPKIIDFGVAKAIEQRLTEHTLTTAFAQMVGTPLYMSPEQAELSPLGVDTRSDIYSLGVLLYELLTGATPFDKDRLHSASYDELRRIIREEEPPRPSTRLTTLAANEATTIAEQRRTDRRRLKQQVRGELDWIVMQCLEKDRNRRYDSVSGLAEDVERYLHFEPVLACPPSARYRIRKFARRNRVGLAMAAMLLLGIAGTSWQAIQATRARNWAVAAEGTAKTAASNAVEARRATRQLLYVSDMGMALRAVETSNVDRALTLLNRYLPTEDEKEDLRGFEWYYLWRQCNRHEWELANAGNVIACSPDGKTFAAGGKDGSVRIFDLATRQLQTTLSGHRGGVQCLVFSPDGAVLASAGADQSIRAWNLESGQVKFTRHAPGHVVNALVFSKDGGQLISGGKDKRVVFWNASTGEEERVLTEISGEVTSLAVCPEGQNLAVGAGKYHKGGELTLFNLSTEQQLKPQGPYFVLTVAYSPDGKSVAAAGRGRTVHVWDAATGKLRFDCGKRDPHWIYSHVYSGHSDWVHSISFSPCGKYLVSISVDQSLRIWNAQTGSLVTSVAACTTRGAVISFIPNQSRFLTAEQSGVVKSWRLEELVQEERIPPRIDDVWSMASSPDGTLLAVSGFRGVQIIDLQTGEPALALKEDASEFQGVCFSPDGKRLVTSKDDGTIEVWSVPQGKLEALLSGHAAQVTEFDFSPDGRLLASASKDGTARLWNMQKMQLQHLLNHDYGWVHATAFSPDGKRLVTGCHSIHIWDTSTGKLQRVIEASGDAIWGVAFSPDGKQIASCDDNAVRLWNAGTGELQATLKNHRSGVFDVAYLDRQTLVSISHDKTVRLWNLRTGQESLELTGHAHYLWDLEFFKPTRTLFTAGTGGEIRKWRAASKKEVMRRLSDSSESHRETETGT